MPSNKDVNGILKTQMENQKRIEREVFFFQLEWYTVIVHVQYICAWARKIWVEYIRLIRME